jgi:hypothetical protein
MNSAFKKFYITQVKYPEFELPHHLKQSYLTDFPLLPICIFHDHEFLIYFIRYDENHIFICGEHQNHNFHELISIRNFKRFLYYPTEFYLSHPYLKNIHSHFTKYDYPVWDIIHDWIHDCLYQQHLCFECIFIQSKWNLKFSFSDDTS